MIKGSKWSLPCHMKWESGICEVNESKVIKEDWYKRSNIQVVEIDPIWEYHSGGGYILNLWSYIQSSIDAWRQGVRLREEATTS
jgi:hypothetical protein